MGSAFTPGGESRGVIPAVMDAIFARVAAESRGVGFTVRVGFVEIHKVGRRGRGDRGGCGLGMVAHVICAGAGGRFRLVPFALASCRISSFLAISSQPDARAWVCAGVIVCWAACLPACPAGGDP